jgi:hypothetical protein
VQSKKSLCFGSQIFAVPGRDGHLDRGMRPDCKICSDPANCRAKLVAELGRPIFTSHFFDVYFMAKCVSWLDCTLLGVGVGGYWTYYSNSNLNYYSSYNLKLLLKLLFKILFKLISQAQSRYTANPFCHSHTYTSCRVFPIWSALQSSCHMSHRVWSRGFLWIPMDS